MVRRLKKDVLVDLPDKVRQPIVLPSTDMKALAKAELKTGEAHDEILIELAVAKELAKTDDEYEAKLKALIDQERIIFAEVAKKRHELAVAKIPLATEHIKNLLEQTDKVVVFAHHGDVLNELKAEFGDTAVMIRSGIKDSDRVDAIRRFQNDDKVRLFLGGIKSAGVGITLTASSTVFFIEQDWTPGLMTQAEDRCHRVGQKNSVLCQYLLIEGTHDAKVANKLALKSDVIRQALDDDIVIPEPEELKPVTAGISRKEITLESLGMHQSQVTAIHSALNALSSLCDGAGAKDGQGFNKVDTRIGKSLARSPGLTPKQAVLGKYILKKYGRQLGSEWIRAIEGE
jgi:SWI/SNF-related matrix-associated actin-dependent regulator 1 of chromatin subfamily A